jgi:predicted RNA binding protein YcfA (HicA-like mRNA interferase family)
LVACAAEEHALPISGKEMLKRFEKAGWRVISRKGSHVKVGRGSEREIIPMHSELKKGLERKLLKRLEAFLED